MLELCLLGCGGMQPLPRRALTALMMRYNGSSLLIDCGEGTQISIKEKGWSFKPLDTICFTHFHGDHISGLPGLLLTMGNAMRTEPLTLIGPRGLRRVVDALRVIAPELPFEVKYIEIEGQTQTFRMSDYEITAFRVNHNVICYGYRINIRRQGRFDVARAKAAGIPLRAWNPLQKGNTVVIDDVTYTPDMVIGKERKGLQVTYCTDTRPTASIVENARGADLFICEGMYGEEDKAEKAKGYKHMTFAEAAALAKEADVEKLWLTHYSPSLVRPEEYLDAVRQVFSRTELGRDRKSMTLVFEEDEDGRRED
ncbi:MAG: ribonuclease Z [Lachnospiraceae bacterium]|nr:ribonuclease Z [Lachnospiraceae bacterium]MDY5741406.1 ribonuclease Z [Lachnospiraceae bacterium]